MAGVRAEGGACCVQPVWAEIVFNEVEPYSDHVGVQPN